jgi:hypothetical protein
MAESVFEVIPEADGGYCAECFTENIFTEGDTWQQLRENVLEATAAFFSIGPSLSVFGCTSSATRSCSSLKVPRDLQFPDTIQCGSDAYFHTPRRRLA